MSVAQSRAQDKEAGLTTTHSSSFEQRTLLLESKETAESSVWLSLTRTYEASWWIRLDVG